MACELRRRTEGPQCSPRRRPEEERSQRSETIETDAPQRARARRRAGEEDEELRPKRDLCLERPCPCVGVRVCVCVRVLVSRRRDAAVPHALSEPAAAAGDPAAAAARRRPAALGAARAACSLLARRLRGGYTTVTRRPAALGAARATCSRLTRRSCSRAWSGRAARLLLLTRGATLSRVPSAGAAARRARHARRAARRGRAADRERGAFRAARAFRARAIVVTAWRPRRPDLAASEEPPRRDVSQDLSPPRTESTTQAWRRGAGSRTASSR